MAIRISAIYLVKRKSTNYNSGKLKYVSGSIMARLYDLLNYYCKIKKIKFYFFTENKILNVKFTNNSYVFISRFIRSKKLINFFEKKKKEEKIKLIFDFDDLIWKKTDHLDFVNNDKFKQTKNLIKTADLILFSNSILQKSFFRDFKLQRSTVLPPYFYTTKYYGHIIKKKKSNLILYSKIGNFGSTKKKLFEKVLSRICKEFNLKILCISQDPLDIKKEFLIYHKPLMFNEYVEKIFNEKILFAVVPIGNSDEVKTFQWNRSKSFVKYLYYSNAGIPTIFTDIEPYTRIIKHSNNGLLTKNTFASWYKNLKLLATNENLRTKIRNNCLIDVNGNHNIHEGFLHLDKALKDLVNK